MDKIQLSTDMTELRYLDADGVWEATLSHLVPGTGDLSDTDRKALIAIKGKESVYIKQETVRAKIVVSCVGILVEPNAWPTSIPGRDKFEGEIFHSARWREDVDFKGKDVVVLGSGCSAAQVVPSLFERSFEARSVTQLMRTAPGLCLGWRSHLERIRTLDTFLRSFVIYHSWVISSAYCYTYSSR